IGGIFFLLAELLLAWCGVRPVLYEEDPYVGFASHIPLFVAKQDADEQTVMVTAENKQRFFNRQQFPQHKEAGTCRIFCLGGSTTYGRPYDDTTSFCGWLRALLPEADRSRRWELINAGGISYASYRVAHVTEELLRYDPDWFIVYCGHNEFLERRTYAPILRLPETVIGLGGVLSHSRLYAATKHVVDATVKKSTARTSTRDILPAEVQTLLDDSVGPSAYQRDDAERQDVLQHYRYNLSRMVQAIHSVGAGVVLVTPASNLRQCAPFKSQHRDDLTETDRARWRRAFTRAKQARADRRWEEARVAVEEALEMDGRYAHAHYLRGRVLWEMGRFAEAKRSFVRARDEDVCPLRAATSMQQIVAEIAAQQHVPLVDFAAIAEQQAEHATPGDDMFLDHVHPTIEGNLLLALALLDTLAQEGWVHPRADWGPSAVEQVKIRVEKRLDRTAHGVAMKNLAKVLNWSGKFEEAGKAARRALQSIPHDAGAHYEAGVSAVRLGRRSDALIHLQQAVRLAPGRDDARNLLGMVLLDEGKVAEAIGQFRKVLASNPKFTKAYVNLGLALESTGAVDRAIGMYRQAIQIGPDNADAHNNLGNALASQGRFAEAIRQYEAAIEQSPEDGNGHYNLAKVLQAQGKTDRAIEHYQRAVRANPDLAAAHNNLGYAFQSQGRFEQAVSHYREALRIDPDYQRARKNLSAALRASGRTAPTSSTGEAAN
ncbi:MAG: tetratricopeptide repeat protein, partial [Pirellulales bacterium]